MERLLRMALATFLLVPLMLVASSAGTAQDSPSRELIWTWYRTDYPVLRGVTNRTWMWGPGHNIDGPYWAIPAPFVPSFSEPYEDSAGGMRQVQYHEKSRMEINDHFADRSSPWFVTNGLLALELITGRLQLGDEAWEHREPSNSQAAGDAHPDSPTYAMLQPLLNEPPLPVGQTITALLQGNGSVSVADYMADYGVTSAYYDPGRNHSVASVFWEFMNQTGVIYEQGEFREGPLFESPFFATGLPITEAYWVQVPVAGIYSDVLLQCFERRCMTYTPRNPHGWQVEAGNIGIHYYNWRYSNQH